MPEHMQHVLDLVNRQPGVLNETKTVLLIARFECLTISFEYYFDYSHSGLIFLCLYTVFDQMKAVCNGEGILRKSPGTPLDLNT